MKIKILFIKPSDWTDNHKVEKALIYLKEKRINEHTTHGTSAS